MLSSSFYLLDHISLAIVLAGALIAGFITGFAGFGTGLVASGFWFLALPAAMVPPLVVLASVAAQIVGVATVRRAFEWHRAVPFLAAGCVGVPIGIVALSHTSPLVLRLTVGLFLVAYALFQLSGLARVCIGSWGGRKADGVVGLAGGVLGGFAGLSGPLPLIWLQLRGGKSALQRATYQPFNLFTLALAGIGMTISGQIDQQVLAVAAMCVPFTLFGAAIGSRTYISVSEDLFRKIVLFLLLGSGATLSIQTVAG